MGFKKNGIDFEKTELLESISVHDQIYAAIGYDDDFNEYFGTATVSCGEIVDISDIQTADE